MDLDCMLLEFHAVKTSVIIGSRSHGLYFKLGIFNIKKK